MPTLSVLSPHAADARALRPVSPDLQAVELEMAPILANHSSKIYTFPGLFARMDALHAARNDAGLNSEQVRPQRPLSARALYDVFCFYPSS